MRLSTVTLTLLLMAAATPSLAARGSDIMPPPDKSPRIPVESQNTLKQPKEYEGEAQAVDGERLLIGEKELRLFGIVTPGLASNYGPSARMTLDKLIKGTVLCKVTDQDKEGRPIAFCGTVDTPDLSYEMLRQGWAMADRKALSGNKLARIYEDAETDAQNQNKGLFAPQPMAMAIPVTNPANSLTVPTPAPVETKTDTKKEEAKGAPAPIAPAPVAEKPAEKSADTASGGSFFERYQGLIGALIWLLASVIFVTGILRRNKQKVVTRRREVAAALQGELMAARRICRTRAKELKRQRRTSENEPRPGQLWPRIRSFVYQGHVGSIGLLGAELARRVASVYGQCADYAIYYQPTAQQRMPSPQAVSETLLTLADHMDIVLDGLMQVEATGEPFSLDAEEKIERPVESTAEEEAEEEAEALAKEPAKETTKDKGKDKAGHATRVMAGMFEQQQEDETPEEGSEKPKPRPTLVA
jgi:endonuclease YncB( thermonuclease family)